MLLSAVVPVKALEGAKTRLAGVLTSQERRDFALAMLQDVLLALVAARHVARVAVISRDGAALALAATIGAVPLADHANDLNGALTQAAAEADRIGADALLVLPADLPLATPQDIDRLVAALPAPRGVVLAPARDGGTNALLLRPPLALPFAFGPDSAQQHGEAARMRDLPVALLQTFGLELDIDTPDALRRLADAPGTTAAQRFVRARPFAASSLQDSTVIETP